MDRPMGNIRCVITAMMVGGKHTILRKLKYRVRQRLGLHPLLFLPTARLLGSRRRRESLVSPSTELVIEGFPRSGNTFAVAAFRLSQPRPVQIAHHHHVPAQIIYAVRRGIPTLVIVRKPDDAVLSVVIREAFVSVKEAFQDYCIFHERILPYAYGYVVATFEELTSDFGNVILRINEKFGTEFARFVHTEDNVERCFRLIEKMDMEDTGRDEVTESTVARPSERREGLKNELRKLFRLGENAAAMEKAYETYRRFLKTAYSRHDA